jgi:hypothetical protein
LDKISLVIGNLTSEDCRKFSDPFKIFFKIAVKNRQDTQKVIKINDVHFEEGTDKTTKPSC